MAYKIGQQVFDEREWVRKGKGLILGAEKTLDILQSRDAQLGLVTMGDNKAQTEKIEVYGLRRWFQNNIFVCDKKTPQVFREVMEKMRADISRTWMIGNSIRSDVLPALEAGLRVVYIPCETWDYDKKHNGLPNSPNLTKVNSIADLITYQF